MQKMLQKMLQKIACITWMDGKQEFSFKPKITGERLLKQFAQTIDLGEIWYFSLQFIDSKGHTKWLKLDKKVLAQDVKKESPLQFKLRVRFYPENIERELIQDITRKLFFLQVKEDILSGNIYCPPDIAELLAFCAEKYEQCYKEEAVIEYLNISQDLKMFGVTYFKMKDKKGAELWLGVDAQGVKIYSKDNRRTPTSRLLWADIRNMSINKNKLCIRHMEKKVPDLKFISQNRHTNRNILELCIGNHIHRQKPNSMEVQQLKARAREQSQWKK